MTWQQQVAALKRQLAGKSKHARVRQKLERAKKSARKHSNEPVIVHGDVSPTFLERMRAMGVRVEVRS